ncbi:MAG: hypothetical protein ABSF14_01500 [Terriglobia bacterium]|jgi:hypothetical protein
MEDRIATIMSFRVVNMKHSWPLQVSAVVLLAAGLGGTVMPRLSAAKGAETKVVGLSKVIAFTYSPAKDFDPKQLRSVTFIGPKSPEEWQYWRARGVVMGVGHTWFDLLRSPLEKAVENLVSQDYGGNPQPLVMIDEFGFDYGGGMDEKSAQILRQTKRRKPELALAVFEMRGPIPPVLAEAYRDVADLVMMESYVGSTRWYWWIASQVWSARRYGILPKTIVVLGVGKGGNPGENWAQTKEELEQQVRFLRLVGPESPGVGFYGGTQELLASADALGARFSDIPTDGAGLPADLLALARTFSNRYEKPTLVVSPALVQPDYNADGSGHLAEPRTMRPYLINLGDQDAHDVVIRLRNPPARGGDVFAEGIVPLIPKRSAAIGVLPVTGQWRVWVGQWKMEVEAPGCDVRAFGAAP